MGQQDILHADISAIRNAGLRLGISTHSGQEIELALAHVPSYIAFGPIYHTTTKDMPYQPQGLGKLKACVKQAPCPVVAIGGINISRLAGVVASKVDGVAILSAITGATDLDATINELQEIIEADYANSE